MAAALDEVGGLLGTESFGADPGGYAELLTWLASFGEVAKVGVEGTVQIAKPTRLCGTS